VIIVDNALKAREAEGRPIRVALVGAGFMAQGLANQIVNSVPGMALVAVYARRRERAEALLAYAGVESVLLADDESALDAAIRAGDCGIVEDALALCHADGVDVVVDVTGSVELGCRVALEAFAHGKHVVAMNAEVDATVGPILQRYAASSGVAFSSMVT